MKHLSTKYLSALALAGVLFVSTVAKADTVGNSVPSTSTTEVDGDQSDGYILTQAFSGPGSIKTYSFFALKSGTLTPVLFTKVGNSFVLTGIGTSFTNPTTGAFTENFGLTSGSGAVSSTTYFGFINQYNGTTLLGSNVGFSYTDPAAQYGHGTNGTNILTYLVPTPSITLNYTYTPNGVGVNNVGGAANREYALSASATPEPSSLALLGTGLASVAGLARRRFKRA